MFVDSSAWIAFFSASDRNHASADAMIRHASEKRVRLLTTNLVAAEVHRLLLFRAGIRAAAVALDRISESPLVTVLFSAAAQHEAARAWLARLGDQAITYTDATSFAVMDEARCRTAMSFDRDFCVAGFSLWEPPRRK